MTEELFWEHFWENAESIVTCGSCIYKERCQKEMVDFLQADPKVFCGQFLKERYLDSLDIR